MSERLHPPIKNGALEGVPLIRRCGVEISDSALFASRAPQAFLSGSFVMFGDVPANMMEIR